MQLTQIQFNILNELHTKGKDGLINYIKVHSINNNSEISTVFAQLKQDAFLTDDIITQKGIDALLPYRAEKAVFLAAGFGSRLAPVTNTTPKPLIQVNGIRIIDTLIDAVLKAGISKVIVVRGYLKDEFDSLLTKYPMIEFLDNPLYDSTNTISSALCVTPDLSNSYIFEADLFLNTPEVVSLYNYNSFYLSSVCEETDDWCFDVNGDFIENVRIKGQNVHRLYGLSYWNRDDGKKLTKHLKELYSTEHGKNCYWDHVPTKYYCNEYKIGYKECQFEDITEIDTIEELIAIDNTYKKFL